MPPAGESYGVTNAGDAEPLGNGHGIVFRCPHAVFRNVMLKSEPVRAGSTIATPIEPWMIGKDLDPRADDKNHEKEIEEILNSDLVKNPKVIIQKGEANMSQPTTISVVKEN